MNPLGLHRNIRGCILEANSETFFEKDEAAENGWR